jgi:hypothetical protein
VRFPTTTPIAEPAATAADLVRLLQQARRADLQIAEHDDGSYADAWDKAADAQKAKAQRGTTNE